VALPSTLVLEVDASTGSDNNGGGFDPSVASPGTDLTYGAGQHAYAYTDLEIGSPSTKLASVSRPFTAADVGNTVNVTGGTGFTTGRYNVRSVVSSNATVDRAVGTTSSTGGTGTLGGAMASPGAAAGFVVSGNTVWVKSGTYTFSATANVSGGRVNSALICHWRGYQTTRGDNGTRPVFDAGAATMTLFTQSSGAGSLVENLDLTNSAARAAVAGFSVGQNVTARRLRATSMTGVGLTAASSSGKYSFCEMVSCAGGFLSSGTGNSFAGCVARSCSAYGFQVSATQSAYWDRCVAYAISNTGFLVASAGGDGVASGCVAYGCTGASGHGFSSTTGGRFAATGSAAYGNAQKGFFGASSGLSNWLASCAGGNNTGGDQSAFDAGTVEGFITLTADPFTNAALLDFTLNTAAGGGALLRAAGWPATLPGLAGTGYPDVGAYQSQAAAGGLPRSRVFVGF
jgi:hypothetical protein